MGLKPIPGLGLVLAVALGGCGDGAEPAEPSAEVVACDDLRRRENELITVANEALADLGATEDDGERTAAIVAGYARLAALAAEQATTVSTDVEAGLRDALVRGAEVAAAGLADARDLVIERDLVVTASDERGRAGELQNALERAFSDMEPPRAVYRSVGLAEATDDDPDCRFVTQRADPAR